MSLIHDFIQFFDSKSHALMLVACVALLGALEFWLNVRMMSKVESAEKMPDEPKKPDGIERGLTNAMSQLERDYKFAVFLCGPSSASGKKSVAWISALRRLICGPSSASGKKSATLRENIGKKLKEEGFEVVLGEDDGLKGFQKERKKDAQETELHYVNSTPHCKAVVIIADSVGSYCELGLFNWLYVSDSSKQFDKNRIHFFVILDKKYEKDESYLNCGPIKNLKDDNSPVHYCDFEKFPVDEFVKQFVLRRQKLSLYNSSGSN